MRRGHLLGLGKLELEEPWQVLVLVLKDSGEDQVLFFLLLEKATIRRIPQHLQRHLWEIL